ncbi:hydroxyacid dehydrogenase [Paraburkholderia aromaticivorans]|uniref:hydroxyacid dehydrogenase n=1 Tax=Paraburkholderia aromaticivorans TaxID=2026199 RepID=UPI0014561FE0|nr:hydroxyacid dehydrogenase [Paraburkholderia aromaticivorans]
MKRVVISEFMDASAVDKLRADFEVQYDPSLVEVPETLREALADAHALIVRNRTQVTRALLDGAPSLLAVGRLGVGLDNIDLDACAGRGVTVHPATGANAQAVAEYVIASALLLLRGVYFASTDVADGRWPRTALSNGRELAGATLAVIGFGGIGQLVARLARALGMQVVGHDPQLSTDAPCWRETGARAVSLDDALRCADVVTLHVPFLPATRNLLDGARIAMLKKGAVVINTARGGIVDEVALAAALRTGHVAGAALDVFANEPLAAASPLAGAPNLILTPHIAGLTVQSNERVSSLVAERVKAALCSAELALAEREGGR